jgi:TolA-binding protein
MMVDRRASAFVCILMLCLILQAGCWGRKFFKMPSETLETSSRVDSLLEENARLRSRISSIERTLSEQQDYSRRSNAQLKIDLEEMKDQLMILQEMLRDTDQSAYYRATGSGGTTGRLPRSGDAEEQVADEGLEEQADSTSSAAQVEGTGEEPVDSTEAAGAVPVPQPEEIHRQVYLDYSRGEYQLAIEESQLFLDEYPDHPLVQEIIFIRGECFMGQEKHFDALKEYSRILQEFPEGKRIPATLLRMAVAYESIGENEVAAGIIRRLVREHPYSEEAALAEERYKDLLEE